MKSIFLFVAICLFIMGQLVLVSVDSKKETVHELFKKCIENINIPAGECSRLFEVKK